MPLVPADQVGAEETYVGAVELPKAPSASQPVDSAQAQALDQWWAGWRAGRLVAKIAIPTLVADGAADHLDPVANAHLLARLIPGATLKLYADASGAFMFQEYPAYPGRARRAVMARTRQAAARTSHHQPHGRRRSSCQGHRARPRKRNSPTGLPEGLAYLAHYEW